jgi:hypothetical protein
MSLKIDHINEEILKGDGSVYGAGGGVSVNVEELTADRTLGEDEASLQVFYTVISGGANIYLPAQPTKDLQFTVVNGLYETMNGRELTICLAEDYSSNYLCKLGNGQHATVTYCSATGIWTAVASGYFNKRLAKNSFQGTQSRVILGDDAYTSTNGVAIGQAAIGQTAVGYEASADGNGTAIGQGADGYGSGVACGRYTQAASSGVAVGNLTKGSSEGTALGAEANCNSKMYGSAIGFRASQQRRGGHAINAWGSNLAREEVFWRGITSDAVPTEIFLIDDASYRCTILASSVVGFDLRLTAKDSTFNVYDVQIVGTIKRDASNNTTLASVPGVTVITDEFAGAISASVTADDVNEALIVTVTGAAATTIDWGVCGRLVDNH